MRKTIRVVAPIFILIIVVCLYYILKFSSQDHLYKLDCSEAIGALEIKAYPIEKGWGFDLYRQKKVYVRQTNIPAVNGGNVFTSKKDAVLVGNLMMHKICDRVLPPTISKAELDSLKINY